MNTGVHLGIGGGYENAVAYAEELGCTTVQIFTHSPRMFAFKPLEPARQQILLDGWKRLKIFPVVSHASYLINIGNSLPKSFYGALSVLDKELIYAKAFGCQYVVFHVGKYGETSWEKGKAQVVKGITKLEQRLEETGVMLLMETAAAQGTEMGKTFEELHEILLALPEPVRKHVGICLDTCHIFAAGYDLSKPERIAENIRNTFGLEKLRVIHVNDSMFGQGERRDRHAHIGMGKIGGEVLRKFLTYPAFATLPMILETPVDDDVGQRDDLLALRNLLR